MGVNGVLETLIQDLFFLQVIENHLSESRLALIRYPVSEFSSREKEEVSLGFGMQGCHEIR